MWLTYMMVALGGAGGALARYLVSQAIQPLSTSGFPWPTLVVNLVGSFVLGVFYVLMMERFLWLVDYRPLVVVGFLGAFTTFSTFSLEIVILLSQHAWLSAAGYLLLSLVVGVLAVSLGMGLVRYFL